MFKSDYYGIPGLVAQKGRNKIIVCCGTGAVVITDVRDENKKINIIDSIKFGNKFSEL